MLDFESFTKMKSKNSKKQCNNNMNFLSLPVPIFYIYLHIELKIWCRGHSIDNGGVLFVANQAGKVTITEKKKTTMTMQMIHNGYIEMVPVKLLKIVK